jgi:hypothetical protein
VSSTWSLNTVMRNLQASPQFLRYQMDISAGINHRLVSIESSCLQSGEGGERSDISQVFKVDDILWVRMRISGNYRCGNPVNSFLSFYGKPIIEWTLHAMDHRSGDFPYLALSPAAISARSATSGNSIGANIAAG